MIGHGCAVTSRRPTPDAKSHGAAVADQYDTADETSEFEHANFHRWHCQRWKWHDGNHAKADSSPVDDEPLAAGFHIKTRRQLGKRSDSMQRVE